MNGNPAPDQKAPQPALVEAEVRAAFQGFDPRKILFLDGKGSWSGNPRSFRDRACHSLFYHLRQQNGPRVSGRCVRAFSPFMSAPAWTAARKMAASRGIREGSSFLVLLEALLWTIEHEVWTINAERPAPEWDVRAKAYRNECRNRLRALEASLGSFLTAQEKERFLSAVAETKSTAASLSTPLAAMSADEERLSALLDRLIEESLSEERREEATSLLLETIQPPLGIVTRTPPAFFFPCLKLLLDSRIDPASGIPHMASLILSIFRDERSAESLLEALRLYPLSATKIRENCIYTLGSLREEQAVDELSSVLEAPDEVTVDASGRATACLLLEQKEEAVWALGKIGLAAVKAVPALVPYADHPSARLKTYLAWTLGEVGRAQKEATGGLSADLVIALLKLLKDRNRQTFEETVNALKKIQLPEFVHSLYLYHVGAISILGLKPAQRGLYELSETVHHLLREKKTTILAVNGDSGTGKTYFCQAIAAGFPGLRPEEILYLMRDSKRGQKVFNRILGSAWLKDHIDPSFYQDDPDTDVEDDPESFLRRFLEENNDKRLVILDGCRDRHYFQRVIDFLYSHGVLDVEVNFRANFSTRRLNLETREIALESVKLHLQFVEEPALEDTSFYQDGLVILYDLDNSTGSRIDAEETKELFERPRVDAWGELIRVGAFAGKEEILPYRETPAEVRANDLEVREEPWPDARSSSFSPEERRVVPVLNENLEDEPNLLQSIPLGDVGPGQLHFYAQDQVAGLGDGGAVFVLTFLDNRIFQTDVEGVVDLALLGRTLYLAAPGRGLLGLSFERNEIVEWPAEDAPPLKLAAAPPDRLISACGDGTIRIWDFLERRVHALAGPPASLSSLGVDRRGRIYGSRVTGGLIQWDVAKKTVREVTGPAGTIRLFRRFPEGKMLAVEEAGKESRPFSLHVLDPVGLACRTIPAPSGLKVNGITITLDGRVIAGCSSSPGERSTRRNTLLIFSPRTHECSVLALSGHEKETRDCLAMGAKIITAGREADGRSSVRVWGSAFFVRMELGKLFIKP